MEGELAIPYLAESFRECAGFVERDLVFNIHRRHAVCDASHQTLVQINER